MLHGPDCSIAIERDGGVESYTGAFSEGLRSGAGIADYPDGSHYEGEFKHGLRNGVGSLRDTDQSIYDGKFVGDKRCGRGTCAFGNGDVYYGLWADNVMEGLGTLRRKDGSQLTGVWRAGELVEPAPATASFAVLPMASAPATTAASSRVGGSGAGPGSSFAASVRR